MRAEHRIDYSCNIVNFKVTQSLQDYLLVRHVKLVLGLILIGF